MRRRLGASRGVLLACLVLTVPLTNGCSKPECRATSIKVLPVVLPPTAALSTLVLRATLTSSGRPMAGQAVDFWSVAPGTVTGGSRLGERDTDASGQAVFPYGALLVQPSPLRAEALHSTAYQAKFEPPGPVGGVVYCWASPKATLHIHP